MYNIAKHPDVQKKCFDEIVTIFGTDTKESTTISKLNQLSYLELVIKETLRLFPSVPFFGRIAMQDIELSESLSSCYTSLVLNFFEVIFFISLFGSF